MHGASGTFDLPLSSVASNPTTEPRQGPTHTIVFTFDGAVTAGTATIIEGTATAGAPTFSGNDMSVPLTGVANAQYVTVAVSGVTTSGGGTGGAGSIRIGFLAGDVNQSRVVSVADLGLVNAQLAQVLSAANFLKDVNASGTLTVADKGVTNTPTSPRHCSPPGDAAPSVVSTVPIGRGQCRPEYQCRGRLQRTGDRDRRLLQIVCTSGTRTPANTAVNGDVGPASGTTFTLDPNVNFAFGDACAMALFAAGVSDNDALDPPDHMAADVVFPFTVSASNSAPVVQNDAAFTAPGAAVQFNVLANDSDADHDPLSVTGNSQGADGSVTGVLPTARVPTRRVAGSVASIRSPTRQATARAARRVVPSRSRFRRRTPRWRHCPSIPRSRRPSTRPPCSSYSGANPPQTGVAPGTIQPTRASILRGRVLARNGNVFPGAIVTINGNTQFGQTISRANGAYDMAVNGARLLTVNIAATGFITAQRQVFVPWQGYVSVPDVVLVPLDAQGHDGHGERGRHAGAPGQ